MLLSCCRLRASRSAPEHWLRSHGLLAPAAPDRHASNLPGSRVVFRPGPQCVLPLLKRPAWQWRELQGARAERGVSAPKRLLVWERPWAQALAGKQRGISPELELQNRVRLWQRVLAWAEGE